MGVVPEEDVKAMSLPATLLEHGLSVMYGDSGFNPNESYIDLVNDFECAWLPKELV